MKTLQNNFTTPEQSKRLLELGVPADSADCMNFGNADIFQIPFQRPFSEHLKRHVQDGLKKMYTPCWSAGRLIEIFELCTGRRLIRCMDRPLVEDVKCRIAFYIHHHKFDFSKIED